MMIKHFFRPACAFLFVTAFIVPVFAAADGVKLPDYERVELDNGTILLLNEKHDVPLIGLRAVLRGGAVTDERGKSGPRARLRHCWKKARASVMPPPLPRPLTPSVATFRRVLASRALTYPETSCRVTRTSWSNCWQTCCAAPRWMPTR